MTRRLLLSIAAALVLLPGPAGVMAAQERVEVCHVTGDGTHVLIEIADPAYDAHVAHGDARPGDPVPGIPAYRFDAMCVPRLTDRIFAVAYTDVDGVDGFDPVAGDVLIAMVMDRNGNDVVDPGDQVVMGRYPKDLAATDFGEFTTMSHEVSTHSWGGELLRVRSGKHLEFTFVSSARTGDDWYSETDLATPGSQSRWLDYPSAGYDSIITSELSPSMPADLINEVDKDNTVDDPFIEVRFPS